MPHKEHQDITSLNIFHPRFKFWLKAGIDFLSEMVSECPSNPQDYLSYRTGPALPTITFGWGWDAQSWGVVDKAGAAHTPVSIPGAEVTLHSPSVSDWTISPMKGVTVPYKQHCFSADGQIQAHRKAAAEKILCRSGREWAHHYWIKCIYFCQHLYDSCIAFLLLEKSVQ